MFRPSFMVLVTENVSRKCHIYIYIKVHQQMSLFCNISLLYIILYYIILYYIILYYIILYYIILYYIILYYIILYYIILYYIILYYIILQCSLMGPPSYMRCVVDRNVMRRMTVVPSMCYLVGNRHSPDSLLSTVHLIRSADFLDAKRSREQDVHNGLSRICIVPFMRHTRGICATQQQVVGRKYGDIILSDNCRQCDACLRAEQKRNIFKTTSQTTAFGRLFVARLTTLQHRILQNN